MSSTHFRRMLYHFLPDGSDGSTKPCINAKEVSASDLSIMKACLKEMNDALTRKKEKRKRNADCNVTKFSKFQSLLPVTKKEKTFDVKEMNLAFARMVVMSMCRSGFLDSFFTQHFFSYYLNYKPPSRRTLYRSLLDELYKDTKEKVMMKLNLKNPDTLLTMSMDAWTAPNGDHIRNYIAVTDGGLDFMLDAEDVGQASQTADAIGEACLAKVEEVGVDSFVAVVTDNAANETTSWDVITDKYPEILCTGCACHAASLMYKDIMTHNWSKKNLDDATTLAKFIKSHTWTHMELKKRTKATGHQKSIILHAATRFAGSYYTMNRLLEVKSEVREMVVSEGFESKKYDNQAAIQRLVQRSSFWSDLAIAVAFLRPLKNLIKLLDHSYHTTHLVVPGLAILLSEWENLKDTVPAGFYRHVIVKYNARVKFMTFPVMNLAYALSPEHHGIKVWNNNKIMAGVNQILRLYLTTGETSEASTELSSYKDHNCPIKFPTEVKDRIKDPKVWWKIHGSNWPTLQSVAIRVFSVGSATAPSERNFSAFGNIWNLRSYSLSSKNAIKLVYIYYNLRKLFKSEVERSEGLDHGWLEALNEISLEESEIDDSTGSSPSNLLVIND